MTQKEKNSDNRIIQVILRIRPHLRMTTQLIDDDDLLPLSTFASEGFSAMDLAKKRLLISQGELSKLLSDYERATSIELVSLVNDNYHDFLQVSNEIREVATKSATLKEHVSPAYVKAKQEIDSMVARSSRMQAELQGLQDTRFDIVLLDSLVEALEVADLADLSILAAEHERVHSQIEATEAVLAEGLRRGSVTIRESLPIVREELARIKSEIVLKLVALIDQVVRDPDPRELREMYRALERLQSESKLLHVLRSRYSSQIAMKGSVIDFLREIESFLMSKSSEFFRVASALPDLDLWTSILAPCVIQEAASKGGLALFVPTTDTLSVFYENISACRIFFAQFPTSPPIVEFLAKFKTSIFVGLYVKRVTDDAADPSVVLSRIAAELLKPELLVDGSGVEKVLQLVLTQIQRLRDTGGSADAVGTISRQLREWLSEYPEIVERIDALMKIQAEMVTRATEARAETEVSHIAAPILQAMEAVKQIPALYRVASRGAPTRHSVYVDLAIKSLTAATSDVKPDTLERVVNRCVVVYATNVTDLLTKEKSRPSAKPGESEKIQAQIRIDCTKLMEYLSASFPSLENLQLLNQFMNPE